jgi:hypothetical protein
MAESFNGVVWASGLLMSIECPMVMVWAGISFGHWTQLHFIDGNLNAQRYHHLMFKHDKAQPHVSNICTQFLKADNVPVLPLTAYSPDMSPIKPVWDALGQRVRQCAPVPTISSNFTQPFKRSGTTFHKPQSTAWSTLCEGDVSRCMRQMVVTPDTENFLGPYFF